MIYTIDEIRQIVTPIAEKYRFQPSICLAPMQEEQQMSTATLI